MTKMKETYMKPNKKYIDANVWNSLSGIAEYTTNDIWNKRYTLLPLDLKIGIDEIKSETYSEMGYLVNKFNPDLNVPLKAYIFSYLQKRVLNNLHKEHHKSHNSYAEFIDGQGKRYDKYGNLITDYIEQHEIGECEFESGKSIRKEIEQRDIINQIYNKANKLDKEIIRRYMNGESMPEIAADYGMTKQAIKKRLLKYGKIN